MQIAYSSPFANPMRRRMAAPMRGRMAAPGTIMPSGQVANQTPYSPGAPRPRPNFFDGTGGIKPEALPTPDIFPPQTPPPMPPPRPFGGNQFGGGIGGFFNQLAMMSPEQYNMGMDRYQQFSQQFGPSMGGGFGMFNQLAQMTPEQYGMGMDRFNQFNQQFGQMPMSRPQMPRSRPQMPMRPSFDPRVMPPPQYLSRPFGGGLGGGFGGGFGGQRFQPQMMPYGRGFGGGFNPMPMTGFTPTPQPMQPVRSTPMQPPGGMMGTTNPEGTLSVGAGTMPQTDTYIADAGEPIMPTGGGGGVF